MFVTISGDPGSGKGTLAKRLAEQLGVAHFSMGDLRRKMAEEKGMTLQAMNDAAGHSPAIEHQLDEYQKKLGRELPGAVIDGRMSFYFIPHSTKIYLQVQPAAAARRVQKDLHAGRRATERWGTLGLPEIQQRLEHRALTDQQRLNDVYGIPNIFDPHNYDFVLDTTALNPEEVFQRVWGYITKQRENPKGQD